jgi:hypothetical protein
MGRSRIHTGPQPPKGPTRSRFVILHMLMTTLGCVAGVWASGVLGGGERILGTIQAGVLIGTVLGLAQWVVVRRHVVRVLEASGDRDSRMGRRAVRETTWWLITTAGGAVAAFLAFAVAEWLVSPSDLWIYVSVYFLLIGLIMGALLSLFNWLMLYGRFPQAFTWVGYTAGGAVVGLFLYMFIGSLVELPDAPDGVNLACILGLSIGFAQGLCLYRLEPLWRKRLLEMVRQGPTSEE